MFALTMSISQMIAVGVRMKFNLTLLQRHRGIP